MAGGGSILFTLTLIVYTVNDQIDFGLAAQNVTLSTTAGSYGNYSEHCEPYYTNYNKNELEAIERKMNELNISTVWLNIRRVTLSGFTWLNGQIYPDPVWGGKGFYCSMFQANSNEMIALSKCTSKLQYALCDRNSMHAGTNSKCSTTNSDAKCYSLDNLPYILLRIEAGNWFDGVNQCNQMDSALASIPTTYNTTILPGIYSAISLLNIGHVNAWIGLRKQEFQYYTSANSSEAVTKYYWKYSSPCQDEDCTGKDCVVQQIIQDRFIWKADKCTSHHHFTCRIKSNNSISDISRNPLTVIAIGVGIVVCLLIFIIIMVVIFLKYKQGKKKEGKKNKKNTTGMADRSDTELLHTSLQGDKHRRKKKEGKKAIRRTSGQPTSSQRDKHRMLNSKPIQVFPRHVIFIATIFLIYIENTAQMNAPYTMSKLPGQFDSQVCHPYYHQYNRTNQLKILQMMQERHITSVWLYVNRVDLYGWKWFNGEKHEFTQYMPEGHNCGLLSDGNKTIPEQCNRIFKYILCQKPSEKLDTMCRSAPDKCHSLGSLPYYLVDKPGTWFDASDFCQQHNSTLAAIPAAHYRSIIGTISTHIANLGTVNVWLGLRKQDFTYNTSANSEKLVPEHFWKLGSPCHLGKCAKNKCIILQKDKMEPVWQIENCSSQHYFVCKISKNPLSLLTEAAIMTTSSTGRNITEKAGNSRDNSGLSVAAIAGIAVAVLAVLAVSITIIVVLCCCRMKRRRQRSKDMDMNSSATKKPLLVKKESGPRDYKDRSQTTDKRTGLISERSTKPKAKLAHEGLGEIHKRLAECLTTGTPTKDPKPKDVIHLINRVFNEMVQPCKDGTLGKNDIKEALKKWRSKNPDMKLESLCNSLDKIKKGPEKLKLHTDTWRKRMEINEKRDDIDEMQTSDEAANMDDHIYRKAEFKIPEDVWNMIMDGLVECLTSRIPSKDESICEQVHFLKQRIIKSRLPDWGLYCESAAEHLVDEWMKNKDLDGVKNELEIVSNHDELKDLANLIKSSVKL